MKSQHVIADWAELQHYKDRNPPWVKLHTCLLTEPAWIFGTDVSRLTMVACMLSACRFHKERGLVDTSEKGAAYLKAVCHLESMPDFNPLIKAGWLIPASEPLAPASNLPLEESKAKKIREYESKAVCLRIIDFLNKKTKKNYPLDARISGLIDRQLTAGFTESDFKAVIAAKTRDWSGSPMSRHLTPTTLFGEKFPEYLGALGTLEVQDEILS